MSRKHFGNSLLAVSVLAFCAGTLQAATTPLTGPSPATINLPCDSVNGPTIVPVGIKLLAAGTPIGVTASVPAGSPIVITPPASNLVSSTTVATTWNFSYAAGCRGAVAPVTITFTPTTGTYTTLFTVVATPVLATTNGTGLTATPSAVNITCVRTSTPTYTVGPTQTVILTSNSYLGMPFTIDPASYTAAASWLSVSAPIATATQAGAELRFSANPTGCAAVYALAGSTSTATVGLTTGQSTAATTRTISVTIKVVAANGVTVSTPTADGTMNMGATTSLPTATAIITNGGISAVTYSVSAASLPSPAWLTVAPASSYTVAATNGTNNLNFAVNAAAANLAVGTYTVNVHLLISGAADVVIPYTLHVNSGSGGTLSISQTSSSAVTWVMTDPANPVVTTNWTAGQAFTPIVITPISNTGTPVAYTIAVAGTDVVTVGNGTSGAITSGVAYGFANPFSLALSSAAMASATPGGTVTDTVSLKVAGSAVVTITVNVNVLSSAASITSLTPSALPTATTGIFTVTVTGSGFVNDGSQATKVGIVSISTGQLVVDSAITRAFVNSSTITLSLNAATPGSYLPFASTTGSITLGACNGTNCTMPTLGTALLKFAINPIVNLVTSASSFAAPTAPALLAVAPYDILSIFGANFCPPSIPTCVVSTNSAVLIAQPDSNLRYVTSISPDPANSTPMHNITVSFYQHGTTTWIADAPLLFATNTQINVIAPAALAGYTNNQSVDVVVSFGSGTAAATLFKSLGYPLTVANTNPGIFSSTGNGQGNAAALDLAGTLIATGNAASLQTLTASDIVQLYVTGLGVPDSDAPAAGQSGYSGTCMSASAFYPLVSSSFTSDDGLVLQPSLFPTGLIVPCMKTAPAVTLGGQPANVLYAGWVPGSVAGLYQINLRLPASTLSFTDAAGTAVLSSTTPVALPLVVSAGGRTSQPTGVNLFVTKNLTMTAAATTATCTAPCTAEIAVAFTVSGGTSYTYAATSTAPFTATATGLTMTTPTAGPYTVSVIATDTATSITSKPVVVTITVPALS